MSTENLKNILFIMADQLRWDYLGFAGHPFIKTPNLDRLAARGLNFTNTFIQGTVCGSSRASFYTGRYVSSHGATYNNYPLRADEWTLGDHLRQAGLRTALVGKTHMKVLPEDLRRLGIDPDSESGRLRIQAGFEPFERDDGLHSDKSLRPDLRYNRILKEQGFDGDNPWHSWANSGVDENGRIQSGWFLKNVRLPARIPEQWSETAYMTNRAMDFIDTHGNEPWCLHLSYIKPHWPYIAPAPYHDLYANDAVVPANRHERERHNDHPVFAAFRAHRESRVFSDEVKRAHVIPAYMGLISQIDHHIGRLLDYLEKKQLLDTTLIVFTSDHGDYLGDHWLGEKEMFFESALRIPLLVVDPRPSADATRGTVSADLVESIDLIPTFMDVVGARWPSHILEGKSLAPALQGKPSQADAVFSEFDYSLRTARKTLGLEPRECRAYMVRTRQWKYARYSGFPPQLFNLWDDPEESHDLGRDSGYAPIRAELDERLHRYHENRLDRITISDEAIACNTARSTERGFYYGHW